MTALEVVFFALAPTLVLALVLYSFKEELADNWGAVLFLAAAAALFFHRILFMGEALSQKDASDIQLQFFTVYREAILGFGQIPFWNMHEGTGVPALAHPLSAMFYPLAPLFLAMNAFRAMGIFVACHYLLGGVFALLLGRRVFRTRQAALAFAVLYAFNGWAMTRAAQQPAIEYVFAYAWLPLVALSFERAVAGKHVLASIAAAGAGLAWMGIACPNVFVYAVVMLCAAFAGRFVYLVVARQRQAAAVAIIAAVGAAAFALALGAVEYLPARELSNYAAEGRFGQRGLADWRGRALSLWETAKLYFPYTHGRPFAVYYSPGVLALAAGLYGVYRAVRGRAHRLAAAGSLALVAIGAALATKSPAYSALAAAWDTFARASLMPSVLVLLVVPATALAALGVEALVEARRELFGWRGYVPVMLIFAELFVGFGLVYPGLGARRLTMDYRREVADFPALDEIAAAGAAGRIVVESPPEGDIIAPSYAVLARGVSRLNLSLTAFAPDWSTRTIRGAVAEPDAARLATMGAGWVASTSRIRTLGPDTPVAWPNLGEHREEGIWFPLRNEPGWVAWNRTVHLYRVSSAPTPVRAEPPTRRSVVTGRSETPLGDLRKSTVDDFKSWTPVPSAVETSQTLVAVLAGEGPTRFFFAITAYPGWIFKADGARVPYSTTAGGFMVVDVPPGTRKIELSFEPTRWKACMALAAAAVFAIAVVGREVRSTGPRGLPRR